ncbi:hypothetical protein NCLIV_002490 [Neospora caninum Liverpool]|uniref:Splicing factor YJU2 n=1 Tax=Neospora caninum (strain Liverpool) TaxID=572307 RepID=F0V7S0_NEOCL|nr:hypothetical protein NCLIV_002490 [Neospora caninum Liverpool]CBZ49761.1 hypothetical protein NCLIV_002490 [Neospora caninum Liverpool]CEL64346.1 TPA: hypothetical protein BN1204_002490 [Neospora caninum Liverpool]|eukprot:XP_003879796.1 hypothetical protein NCLIV_002490 [Neospora caninum Liverpool]
MADRKVLVRYYPPDFDFDVLRQKKRVLYRAKELQHGKKQRQSGMSKIMNVRMMFPFTLQCASCREFVYVGTKFNSRVERVQGEDYLGIVKWRFYGRCPNCRGEICFKTDPKNGDYVLEWGGTRTYDPMRDQQLAEERLRKDREQELEGDRMKQVEAKTYNVQNELAALEQLEELRKMNRRLVDREAATEQALQFLRQNEVKHGDEDEWDDQERTELMKFMQTQRERRDREEEDSDSEDEGTVNQSALRSQSPFSHPGDAGANVAARARSTAASSHSSSRPTSPSRSGALSPRSTASEEGGSSLNASEGSRAPLHSSGRRSEGWLGPKAERKHFQVGGKDADSRPRQSAPKAPGTSAAAPSMFMLTAVSDKSPRLVVKKKEESDSFSDLLGSYASSSSSDEEKGEKDVGSPGKGHERDAREAQSGSQEDSLERAVGGGTKSGDK